MSLLGLVGDSNANTMYHDALNHDEKKLLFEYV